MRVAIYAHDFVPEHGGGYTYEQEILEAVAATRKTARHDLCVVGHASDPPRGWEDGTYLSVYENRGRRIVGQLRRRARATAHPRRRPRSRLDEAFVATGADLVWCLGGATPTYELPYVATVWDLQHRRQPIFPEVATKGIWEQRERDLSRDIGQAAVVVVGTDAGRAEVEGFYGVLPERIRKLPHPTPSFAMDPTPSDDGILAEYGLAPGFLFYPAQFWAHKNHVILLHALRLLRDDHDLELQAVFVGSDKGNEQHVRRTAQTLDVERQVHFLGFVPRPHLVALYRNAFALGYMSFFGPENLPPLEAFALGCPVVASNVPGAEEQLGEAALLVPPTSETVLAAALLSLQRNPELRHRLIERGHARARSFTAADYVEGMMGVLDELQPVIRTWR